MPTLLRDSDPIQPRLIYPLLLRLLWLAIAAAGGWALASLRCPWRLDGLILIVAVGMSWLAGPALLYAPKRASTAVIAAVILSILLRAGFLANVSIASSLGLGLWPSLSRAGIGMLQQLMGLQLDHYAVACDVASLLIASLSCYYLAHRSQPR